MLVDFEGKDVVVTGVTGELGHAVAATLVAARAVCHAPVRSLRGGEALPQGVRVVSGVEVTEERSVSEFYAGIPRLFASIHCVGGFAAAPLVETSFDAFSRLMAGNAASCFLCTREAVRRMAGAPDSGAGRGRIVNVAAQQALDPRKGAGMAAYAASKAAVAALTQAIAEEVASQGIFVNAVAPSILDTPANRKAMPDADPSRWPKVEEVAATIAFLASPQNLSARGGVVPVYGRT